MKAELLSLPVLHADETPVAQLDPGAGKTHRAYLFAYRSADPDADITIFDYCQTRSGKHATGFLGDWRGALMVDDFAGYKALFPQITELACWAHARRKFNDLVQSRVQYPRTRSARTVRAALPYRNQRQRTGSTATRRVSTNSHGTDPGTHPTMDGGPAADRC